MMILDSGLLFWWATLYISDRLRNNRRMSPTSLPVTVCRNVQNSR